MLKPALVIFDCDGVLVDSKGIAFDVSREMAAELGISLSFEEHERYFGIRDSDMFNCLAVNYGVVLPEDFLRRVEEKKMTRYLLGVPAITGALHAVRKVAEAGLPMCVASSGTKERTNLKLKPLGLLAYFGAHVFSGYEVSNGKPSPDIFLYASEKMGVDPGDCVVIEDSAAGVQAGMEAGMRVLGYSPKSDMQGLSDLGAEVFVSMAEVPGLIGL